MGEELISLDQAADLLSVSSERVRQLVNAGILPGVKFGNAWAVPRAAALARRRQQGRKGRPLGALRAWQEICSGRVDLGNLSRYVNRASLLRVQMSRADLEYLSGLPEVMVGGVSGAIALGAPLVDDPERAWLYLEPALFDRLGSLVVHVPDPLGSVNLRVLPAEHPDLRPQRPRGGPPNPAPPGAVALDLMESPDPRHWLAAEQLVGR